MFQIATAGVTPTTVFQVYTTGGTARLGLRGDMIIDGSVTANKMSVATLSAITGNMGSLTTGSISSPDGRFVIDATNQRIVISD